MTYGAALAWIFACIFIQAIYATAQASLDVVRRSELEEAADQGDERAASALLLLTQAKYRATTVSARILAGFTALALALHAFSAPVEQLVAGLPVAPALGFVLSQAIVVITCAFVLVVCAEFVPLRISYVHALAASRALAGLVKNTSTLLLPFVAVARSLSQALARIFGVSGSITAPVVSEEEIKSMVDDAEELEDDEKRMIQDILGMGDTLVREIMTPRADMIFVEDTESLRQAIDRMRGTGYSRIPVFHEDYDRVVGIVRIKDLIVPLMEDRFDDEISEYIESALFIPSSKPALALLSEMQEKRQQMAIVVDEYGGTAGLITLEDIIEEVVGEITDETDLEDRDLYVVDENTWMAKGSLSCEDAVELGWPVVVSDDYDTIAGWLLDGMDYVPQIGTQLEHEGYRFTIKAMRRRRISTIKVERI